MASADLHGGRVRIPRSRGAVSGVVLIVLGAWGALIPLVGPYADFGYTPDSTWDFTTGHLWYQVLPGAGAFVAGVLLLLGANRVVISAAAWLAVAAGAWFVVGPTLASRLSLGDIGTPIHTTAGHLSDLTATFEQLLCFSGIGAAILLVGAVAVGRLGVVSVRDVKVAQRRDAADRYETPRAETTDHEVAGTP